MSNESVRHRRHVDDVGPQLVDALSVIGSDSSGRRSWRRIARILLVGTLLFGLLTAQPAMGQAANPVCEDESGTLADMIEGLIQITTALGVIGLLVVWQVDELAEMFTLRQERKKRLKAHKMGALKSAAILVILGPLFTVAGGAMGLPIAQCVNLIPF